MEKRIESAVADKFRSFISNLAIEHTDYIREIFRVLTRALNEVYYGNRSDAAHAYFIGSYGRGTAIRGVANINILFEMPVGVQKRLEIWGQKAPRLLIDEVRELVRDTFPMARMYDQGRIIIPSLHQLHFELIPAFPGNTKNYIYPDLNSTTGWSSANPLREIEALEVSDSRYNGKTRHLARMMKAWRSTRQVPMSAMLLDTLVVLFMEEWEYNDSNLAYYGIMSRDFLEYMAGRRKNQAIYYAPGSNRELLSPEDFGFYANEDFELAALAVKYEAEAEHIKANEIWQKVFGPLFQL